jgi:hypothetical protein
VCRRGGGAAPHPWLLAYFRRSPSWAWLSVEAELVVFFLLLHFISRACARDKLKRRYLGLLSVRYGEVCLDLRFQRGFTKVAVGSTALCRLRSHGEAEPNSQFFSITKCPLPHSLFPMLLRWEGARAKDSSIHPGSSNPTAAHVPGPCHPPPPDGRFPASARAAPRVRETVGRKWFPDLNLAAPALFFSGKSFCLAPVLHVHGSLRSVRRKLPPTQTGKHGFHPPVPCFASSRVYLFIYRNTPPWRGQGQVPAPLRRYTFAPSRAYSRRAFS